MVSVVVATGMSRHEQPLDSADEKAPKLSDEVLVMFDVALVYCLACRTARGVASGTRFIFCIGAAAVVVIVIYTVDTTTALWLRVMGARMVTVVLHI